MYSFLSIAFVLTFWILSKLSEAERDERERRERERWAREMGEEDE